MFSLGMKAHECTNALEVDLFNQVFKARKHAYGHLYLANCYTERLNQWIQKYKITYLNGGKVYQSRMWFFLV